MPIKTQLTSLTWRPTSHAYGRDNTFTVQKQTPVLLISLLGHETQNRIMPSHAMQIENAANAKANTTCPALCKAASLWLSSGSLVWACGAGELLARNASEVVRMSRWTAEVVVAVTLLEVVTVVTGVVTVVVSSNGTKGSGLIVTTGALRVPTTATVLPSNACNVVCTTSPRNAAVYNCPAIVLVDDPSGTVTKQLSFVPTPPAVLADSAVDEPPSSNRSFTDIKSSPRTSATLLANAERISDSWPSLRRENFRFNTSTVTRAEAPSRQYLLP